MRSIPTLRLALVFGLGALTACGGRVESVEDEPKRDDPPDLDDLSCDESLAPAAIPLRRLSRRQLSNTIGDLVQGAMGREGGGEGDAVLAEIASALAAMPEDLPTGEEGRTRGGFRRLDQAVHQAHIDAANNLGIALGRAMTATPERLQVLVGACATDDDSSNDEACVTDFIARFGERALRRPLTADERAFYVQVFVGESVSSLDPAGIADVVAVMVGSPQMQYFVEHGTDAVDSVPDVYALDDYELASRLSYHFWQTMPDEELLAAAKSGELSTDEGWQRQVDRVFADPRTRQSLRDFFREMWWLDGVAALDARVGTPVFDAFRGDFSPTADTTTHVVDEVLDMALYYALDTEGTFDDILLSDRSFAKTPDVAGIYGVAPWTSGEPPRFDDPNRVGLVTRAALLVTGSANTRPVMKGVFLREGLLCDEIPPPPNNAAANPPALSPDQTTREVVEALTEAEGTACAGCHATVINPMGFVTEGYDALGRARTEQTLFDEEGREVGRRPVQTEAVPAVGFDSDEPASGPADLAAMLADSGRPHVCLARNYVRYTLGRIENDDTDACMIEDIATRLLDGESLGGALRQIALRPEFRQREFRDTEGS
jgi:hypothetical protein